MSLEEKIDANTAAVEALTEAVEANTAVMEKLIKGAKGSKSKGDDEGDDDDADDKKSKKGRGRRNSDDDDADDDKKSKKGKRGGDDDDGDDDDDKKSKKGKDKGPTAATVRKALGEFMATKNGEEDEERNGFVEKMFKHLKVKRAGDIEEDDYESVLGWIEKALDSDKFLNKPKFD